MDRTTVISFQKALMSLIMIAQLYLQMTVIREPFIEAVDSLFDKKLLSMKILINNLL